MASKKLTRGKSNTGYFARTNKSSKRAGYRKLYNRDLNPSQATPVVKPSNTALGNAYALVERKITEAVKAKGDSNKPIGFQRIREPKNEHKRKELNLAVI